VTGKLHNNEQFGHKYRQLKQLWLFIEDFGTRPQAWDEEKMALWLLLTSGGKTIARFISFVLILSVFGPGRALGRRVNLCRVLPDPDGDARRIHGDLSWFGQRRPYVQRGRRVLYFLAPKYLRRSYKL
jgi:hypothetical protein